MPDVPPADREHPGKAGYILQVLNLDPMRLLRLRRYAELPPSISVDAALLGLHRLVRAAEQYGRLNELPDFPAAVTHLLADADAGSSVAATAVAHALLGNELEPCEEPYPVPAPEDFPQGPVG